LSLTCLVCSDPSGLYTDDEMLFAINEKLLEEARIGKLPHTRATTRT
jgi:hypothetical protein